MQELDVPNKSEKRYKNVKKMKSYLKLVLRQGNREEIGKQSTDKGFGMVNIP